MSFGEVAVSLKPSLIRAKHVIRTTEVFQLSNTAQNETQDIYWAFYRPNTILR